MPRIARFATALAFSLHGCLILAARYRSSYDAYVHMFFADHYRMDWWSLWDARWYTGFWVTSYPPLVHQLIALLSKVVGLDKAYAIVLWITVTILPLAVYYFARIFVGRTSAAYASLGAALLPSLFLSAHIFGQLPFLFGTVLALFGAASLARYLREGGPHNFALTVALMTTTTAAHHGVLLVQPFLLFTVVMKRLLGEQDLHVSSRTWIARFILVIVSAIPCSLLVIFPFWQWGQAQTMQTPIDHLSRHSFFTDPFAPLLFFLPIYGPLVLIIPSAIALARRRKLIGLGFAFLILFLLGLGGTTPLPRLLFGKGWAWLTYDRFGFWASLLLLPFFGMIVILLRRNRPGMTLQKLCLTLTAFSLIVGLVTVIVPLQPGAVDMREIVRFLKQDGRSDWRYLTFGFGDQLALLSTLTTATTMDGSYHTARTLPELRSSGVAQIDTAFWLPNGLTLLEPILQKAGERGVRWGFVNIPQYVPILERNGWIRIATLKGGVQVWENPVAVLPAPSKPPAASPFTSFAWGTFPLLSLITTLSLASLRLYPLQAEQALRSIYAFLMGLLPLSLCFWYYKTVGEFSHPRVYFTYDSALFFLADAIALLAITLWFCVKINNSQELRLAKNGPAFYRSLVYLSLFALLLLSTLSTLWSADWRTSLYISLHLWLVVLLILSLRDWKESWKPVMYGLCAALAIQIIAGLGEFALGSTSFLGPWQLKWPGLINAATPAASVVQLENGSRLLRAYGTLAHPNILGGFTLLCLLGPASLYLENRKPNYAALVLFAAGVMLLSLTFSRSAWLALLAFVILLSSKNRFLDARRLFLLLAVTALTLGLTLYPLRDFVFTRLSDPTIHTEQISAIGRSWLSKRAMEVIRQHPLTGVGLGSFVIELSNSSVPGAPVEPVHNLFLLIGSELGMPGLLVIAALFITVFWKSITVRTLRAILASGTLAGLGAISFFDHYLWSVAPGRLMLGLALGIWAGQVVQDDA